MTHSDNNTGTDIPESPLVEPMAFSASNRDAGFTFRQPICPNADTVNHIEPLEAVTITENSPERKRAKGHPDGPTPTSSPRKKRTRTTTIDDTSLPQPSLLFPPSQSSTIPPSSRSSDIFGIHRNNTLTSYWKVETLEEKTERNHRDFEELSQTREAREREEERASAIRRDRQRMHDRERQQKHRDGIREIKVANGWKPRYRNILKMPILLEMVWHSFQNYPVLVVSSKKIPGVKGSHRVGNVSDNSRKPNKQIGNHRLSGHRSK
jgi:hypothetical protein